MNLLIRKTLQVLGAGMVLIVFTGCFGGKELKPKTLNLNDTSKTYYVIKKDPVDDKEVTKEEIVVGITGLLDNSMQRFTSAVNRSKYKHVTVNSDFHNNELVTKIYTKDATCEGEVIGKRKLNITDDGERYRVDFFTANNIFISAGCYKEMFVFKTKDCMPGGSEKYTIKLMKHLPDSFIVKEKRYKFKGEVNSKYPDNAIYGNFERMLGHYRYKNERLTDSQKKNVFALDINGNKFPITVEVYPYRDGSKVIYSSTINYEIDSNGKYHLTQKMIEDLHAEVNKVINN